MHFLEKAIIDNSIDTVKEALRYKNQFENFTNKISGEKTALEIALDLNRYEIVNLMAKNGVLGETSLNFVLYTIAHEKMNEITKLRYLQLFSHYGFDVDIKFMAKSPIENDTFSHSILEYTMAKDYLKIFEWLLKQKTSRMEWNKDTLLELSLKGETDKIARHILRKETPPRIAGGVNDLNKEKDTTPMKNFFEYWRDCMLMEKKSFEEGILSKKCALLIEHGFDINSTDMGGNNILQNVMLTYEVIEDAREAEGDKGVGQELNSFIKYLAKETDLDLEHKNRRKLTAKAILEKADFKDKFKEKLILSLLKR